MTYYDCVGDPKFFRFLTQIDCDLASSALAAGCPFCGDGLHRADFQRSGHGLPAGCGDDVRRRFSFCCRRDGCRRRTTPDSVRFLRRKAYVALVVALVAVINDGASGARAAALASMVRVDRRTVARWRLWWQTAFRASTLWRGEGGAVGVDPTQLLPEALLAAFAATAASCEYALECFARFVGRWR